jgi:hypothetical protein
LLTAEQRSTEPKGPLLLVAGEGAAAAGVMGDEGGTARSGGRHERTPAPPPPPVGDSTPSPLRVGERRGAAATAERRTGAQATVRNGGCAPSGSGCHRRPPDRVPRRAGSTHRAWSSRGEGAPLPSAARGGRAVAAGRSRSSDAGPGSMALMAYSFGAPPPLRVGLLGCLILRLDGVGRAVELLVAALPSGSAAGSRHALPARRPSHAADSHHASRAATDGGMGTMTKRTCARDQSRTASDILQPL